MAPRAQFIELSGSNASILISFVHVVNDLFEGLDLLLAESVNINAIWNALSDLQVLVCGIYQVIYAFVVDFDIAHTNVVAPGLPILLKIGNVKDFFDG